MMSCPAPIAPSPFTLALSADAGDGGSFAAISAQCAALPARPLTAGSYTDPETQLTVHWPEGWTLTTIGDNATFVTLTTPVTWVPTGSTTALQDQASFTLSVFGYGNADQVPQAVPDAISAAAHAEGAGMALTLAGHPGAIWWRLAPPAQPDCPAPCLTVPPSPEILTIGGLVQFTTVPGGGGLGVEVDLAGSARADAQPQQVFCDIEAMILGVTLAP